MKSKQSHGVSAGEIRRKARDLRHVADVAAVALVAIHLRPGDFDHACIRSRETENGFYERGLARRIRTHDAGDAPCGNLRVDSLENLQRAVTFAKASYPDHVSFLIDGFGSTKSAGVSDGMARSAASSSATSALRISTMA